jgi:hypothetical protein
MTHSLKRGVADLQAVREGRSREIFFADFPGLRYPQDYPRELVNRLQQNGVSVAQLDGAELARALDLRAEALGCGLVDNCLPAGA